MKTVFRVGSLFAVTGVTIAVVACSDDPKTTPAVDGGNDSATEAAVVLDAAAEAEAGPACQATSLPGSYGSKQCNECMAATCCGVITTCEADPACKKMQACTLGCLNAPDGGACYAQCKADNPDGQTNWDPVDKCWFTDPPAGCLVSCT